MTTRYKHNILVIVPPSLRDDANQFALAMGETAGDVYTFTEPNFQKGLIVKDKYYVANTVVTDRFLTAQPDEITEAPAHASDVDLEAANRARVATEVWLGQGDLPELNKNKMLALFTNDPHGVLKEYKLKRIEKE